MQTSGGKGGKAHPAEESVEGEERDVNGGGDAERNIYIRTGSGGRV